MWSCYFVCPPWQSLSLRIYQSNHITPTLDIVCFFHLSARLLHLLRENCFVWSTDHAKFDVVATLFRQVQSMKASCQDNELYSLVCNILNNETDKIPESSFVQTVVPNLAMRVLTMIRSSPLNLFISNSQLNVIKNQYVFIPSTVGILLYLIKILVYI